METQNCSNCDSPLSGNFCSSCGQSAETHRITAKHFVEHELIHGVWHMDNKIIFTLKELFTRPGKAAKDYLSGKRLKYYNVFYLLLLVVGLDIAITHLLEPYLNSLTSQLPEEPLKLFHFIYKYPKFIILGQIPLFTLNSWLLLRKLQFNFAEHLIIVGFAFLGMTIINLLLNSSKLLLYNIGSTSFIFALTSLSVLRLLYFGWVYYQICQPVYSISGFIWKMTCFFLLTLVEIIAVASLWIILF